jgi:hypothetical protein
MDLAVLSPFSATTFEWTLAGGQRAVTVVCKLTFPLQPGTDASLAPVQDPIVPEDRVDGAGDAPVLLAASDLVPYKAGVDVLVTGAAYLPPSPGAKAPSARLVVGTEIDKTLETSGRLAPAGFGPLVPASPLRVEKLGGAPIPGSDWVDRPLPWTIDPAFFNVAPADQRLKLLHANEAIMLFGLLPDREKFGMRLPGVQPRAFAQNGGDGKDVPLAADTVWIDTERARVAVTWRGQLPVGSTARRVVVALQERDVVLSWADLERRLPGEVRANGSPTPLPPVPPPMAPTPVPPAVVPPRAPSLVPPPPKSPSPSPVVAPAPLPAFIGRRPAPDESAPPREEIPPPGPRPQVSTAEALDLLWFDAAVVPKLRTDRAWRRLIDRRESDDAEDRCDVFEVLAHADAHDVTALSGALANAIAPDGKLAPPLVVVAGDVCLPFDAAELLRVTLAACKPVAATDKTFGEVVAAVAAMADAAILSDAVAQDLTTRLREAFQRANRTLPEHYLESTVERELLEGRRYQRREVFGAPHVRALVGPAAADAVPAYLPSGVGSRLPLFHRFRCRVVAEVHAPIDQEDGQPCALRVMAIARALARPA